MSVNLGDDSGGGGIEFKTIETSGISHGPDGDHAVPNETVTDFEDLHAQNPYEVPHKDPAMHYQWISKTEMGYYASRFRAVPVTRTEFNIPEEMQKEYGKPGSAIHEMYDAVYVKMPLKLYNARNEQKNQIARDGIAALEPNKEVKRVAQEDGFEVNERYRSTVAERMRGGS